MDTTQQAKAMQKAIEIATGQTALARMLGCTQGLVWHYLNGGRQIPPERCKDIERFTGVSCDELRPDIEWDRDHSGAVIGYRVKFSTAATVDPDPSTVESANAGAVEESNQ